MIHRFSYPTRFTQTFFGDAMKRAYLNIPAVVSLRLVPEGRSKQPSLLHKAKPVER
jgi:hypothetical protein